MFDICRVTRSLRCQRSSMINSFDQYEYLYKFIADVIELDKQKMQKRIADSIKTETEQKVDINTIELNLNNL